jgi:hypothetical protein
MNDVVVPPGVNDDDGDLSDDAVTVNPGLAGRVGNSLQLVARDVQVVRRVHYGVVLATAVPVLVLLTLLSITVWAFGQHVMGAQDFLKHVINAKPAAATTVPVSTAPAPKLSDQKSAKAAQAKGDADKKEAAQEKSKEEDDLQLSDQARLYKMISSYETNLSTSSVAVISILVIAIVVITVAILRSALDLVPYDPSKKPESDAKSKADETGKDEGYAVPIIEFGKRLKELFAPFFEKK